MTIVAEPALAVVFHSGSIGYGLLASAWGAGSVIGALVAERRMRAENELALLFMVVGGVGEGVGGVAGQGIFQRRTPDEVRSRVLGALEATILLSLAMSFVIAGPVVGAIGARWTYAIGGLGFVFAAAILSPAYHRERARSATAT